MTTTAKEAQTRTCGHCQAVAEQVTVRVLGRTWVKWSCTGCGRESLPQTPQQARKASRPAVVRRRRATPSGDRGPWYLDRDERGA